MKTIVCAETNRSLYLLEDDAFVQFTDKEIYLSDFTIGDLNKDNAVLVEGVDNPEEYIGGKYFYTAEDGWEIDPAFSVISPTEEPR